MQGTQPLPVPGRVHHPTHQGHAAQQEPAQSQPEGHARPCVPFFWAGLGCKGFAWAGNVLIKAGLWLSPPRHSRAGVSRTLAPIRRGGFLGQGALLHKCLQYLALAKSLALCAKILGGVTAIRYTLEKWETAFIWKSGVVYLTLPMISSDK